MFPPTARALLALLLALCVFSPILTAFKPLHPRNVKLTSVEKGLKVTWEPPNELDGRPVDRYSIGYGKSMRSLRFIKVDKDRRSEVLEDVEPGVLHMLKISSENEDGMSKPVYRAETPGGGEMVKLDGFAVEGGSSANVSSPGRRSSEHLSKTSSRATVQRSTVLRQRAPQSSSGPEAPRRGGYLPIRNQNKPSKKMDLSQPQADQRNANKPKLASESVYVVSLQAQKAPQRNVPASKTVSTERPPPEHDAVEEVEDITVRILSPQSVVITWVDPLVKKQKGFPEGTRKYTVRYREKGESARWEYKETSQRRLVIEKLSADGMYEFSVRITQGEQDGKWSVSIFQRTPESAPAGPPENFEVTPVRGKGTAVTATWDPPDEPNGKIREYILSYAPALKPFGAKSVTYRGTTTSASIDGLTPGDRYIFKIRAANRKGQGPQSKALSVAMPGTSTTASRHSTQSKSPSRTSVYDGATEDTDESLTHATTSPPTNKKFRPLSQTRSYHSIFSSIRGSVRKPASNSRTTSDKEQDEEETPTDAPVVTEATANEAAEDTRPESTNNAPSPTEKEEQHKASLGAKDSSSILKGSLPKTNFYPPKFKEGNHQSQSLTPHTSSVVSGSRLRRPSSGTPWSRTRNQNGASSSVPSSQDPVVPKKVHTSLYPDGKSSSTVTKSSTPSPLETKMESDRQSSSALSSAETSRVSSPASHASNSGSGPVYANGRRVPQTKGHRYHPGRQKTALTSSALSKGSTASITDDQDTHSALLDTKHDSKYDQKINIKKTEDAPPSYRYTTTIPTSIKEENTQDAGNGNNKDKVNNSYLPSPQIPSTTSPRHGSSLSNKSSRTVVGSSQRKDGRIPWSRTASSVGAGRPVLRGTTLNPTASGDNNSRKNKTLPETHNTKPLFDANLAKPTVQSRQASLSNGRTTSTDQKEDTKLGNDHTHDYISEVSKETQEINNKNSDPTASSKTVASDAKQSQRSRQTSDKNSQSSFTNLNRLGLGSNGKVRSALLASRLNEFMLRGKLQTVQNTPVGSAAKQSSSSSPVSTSSSYASQTTDNKTLPSEQDTSASHNPNVRSNVELSSHSSLVQPSTDQSSGRNTPTDLKTPLTAPARNPVVRSRYASRSGKSSRGKTPISLHKPGYGQGKNGRPNLTATNSKIASTGTSNENTKGNGVKYITGPDGSRWVVDLDKGVLINEDGKVLQDSRGRPRKVVLGEDGKTIFDEEGSPLVNPEGMALFGHGRDSRPVVNPKDKYLTVGGKRLVGLDRPTPSTTTTTTATTTTTTTTTTAEPTTTEMTTLEYTTEALPTCPPGTFSRLDKNGIPMMDDYGVLDCYPSDDFLMETTEFPTTEFPTTEFPTTELPTTVFPTQLPATTHTLTTESRLLNNSPISEFDAAGKKRFTAPYVNFIQKDPGAPCSLTEALEYLQVDVLADLIEKDSIADSQKQPPKHMPHNITVIAMEGCHSFVILDWARPLKDDMVSGYMVHSASYDDILNNRWSSSLSSGTHLAVENLKPNSRYYFRVQAKNVFGLGPISETISYVTESDDPLLIERPPGGEPIWVPFTFRYNPAHSSCKGSQFVKRTWYRKFVGVVLCNSLRYKIFMGDGLKETFYSIADSFGIGEDHCQFVDSHLDGRTGPQSLSIYLPQAQGYYRSFRQEPVSFGPIGRRTAHQFVGWYECGVPIPGKW